MMSEQIRFRCGPSGGKGGDGFEDTPPPKAKISQVNIWVKEDDDKAVIHAIQVEWLDDSNSDIHGEAAKYPMHHVTLRDDEYLVGISGKCGDHLDKITFHTTNKDYPFGGTGGDVEFYYNLSDDGVSIRDIHIVGFMGRDGDVIDAIGCIFALKE